MSVFEIDCRGTKFVGKVKMSYCCTYLLILLDVWLKMASFIEIKYKSFENIDCFRLIQFLITLKKPTLNWQNWRHKQKVNQFIIFAVSSCVCQLRVWVECKYKQKTRHKSKRTIKTKQKSGVQYICAIKFSCETSKVWTLLNKLIPEIRFTKHSKRTP